MQTIVSTAALKGADTRPSGRGGFTPPGLARASPDLNARRCGGSLWCSKAPIRAPQAEADSLRPA